MLHIRDGLAYVEEFEGGGSTVVPAEVALPEIDYKSRIVIHPDRKVLGTFGGRGVARLSPLGPGIEGLLERFPDLISAARSYVAAAEAADQAVEAARAAGTIEDPEVKAEIRGRISEQAALGRPLQDAVVAVAEGLARAKLSLQAADDDPNVAALVEELTDAIYLDPSTGKDVILNPEALAEFLNEGITVLARQIQADQHVAEGAGTVKIRLQAWLRTPGSEDVAVHVENYDDIRDPLPPKEPRVSWRLSPEDQERLEREYAVTEQFASLVRDAREKDSDLRRGLRDLSRKLFTEVRAIPALAKHWLSDELNSGLEGLIRRALESPEATESQRQDIRDLSASIQGAKPRLDAVRQAIEEIQERLSGTAPLNPLDLFASLPASVEAAWKPLSELIVDLRSDVKRLGTLAEVLKQMDLEPVAADALSRVLPESEKALDEFRNDSLARYESLFQRLMELSGAAVTSSLASGLEPPPLDATAVSRSLAEALPGTVFVHDTPADRGSLVAVRAELLTSEAGREVLLGSSTQTFEVTRFGLWSRITSHLAFVDRRGREAAGDPETTFDPAPSVSWTLHYTPRVEASGDRGERLWTAADPGLGINVAALDFEDESVQLGIGVHATLFHDLVQAGYGYNLNADQGNGYFFVGIGLAEALRGLGGLMGGATAGGD